MKEPAMTQPRTRRRKHRTRLRLCYADRYLLSLTEADLDRWEWKDAVWEEAWRHAKEIEVYYCGSAEFAAAHDRLVARGMKPPPPEGTPSPLASAARLRQIAGPREQTP